MQNAGPPQLPVGKRPPPLNREDNDTISNYFWWISLICCAIALSALLILLLRFGGDGGSSTASGSNGSSASTSGGAGGQASPEAGGAAAKESPVSESAAAEKKDAAPSSVSEPTDAPASPAEPASEPSTENESTKTTENVTEKKQEHGINDGESPPSEGDEEETKQSPKSGPEIGLFSESSAGFFGIEVKAEKVAYVVDVSSSMSGWMMDANAMKLDGSKQELMRSISALSQKQRFTVVMFNDQAIFDKRFELAKPTKKCIGELNQALASTYPSGGTDPEQALLSVVQGDYDAIFLLSDGEFDPTTLAVIKQANTKHIVINSICLGADAATLQLMAKESGGQYRSIQ